MKLTSMTLSALPLILLGCGDLTEGGPSATPGSIGKLMLVENAPAVQGESVSVTKRVVATAGTGSIGAVAVTYYDLDTSACNSPLPEVAITCPTAPDAVTIGPDGAPWYASGGYMVRIAEDDTAVRVPRAMEAGFIGGLASGPDALWAVTAGDHQGILRFDPTTGASDFYTMPGALSRPVAVAVDARGEVLVAGANQPVVGRIDAHRNVYVVAQETAPAPITVALSGVAVGPAGAIHVSDYATGRVGRVNGNGFVWTDLGGDSHAPSGIVEAPDGSVWFADLGVPSRVGYIDPAGTLHSFPLPASLEHKETIVKTGSSMAVASDGSVWFTVFERDAVVRVTTTGEFSIIQLEPNSIPRGLVIDARGSLWVTTGGFARIDLGS